MEVEDYLTALESDGRLLADRAATVGLGAPIPTCPDWVVRDLVRHLGGVHRWATEIVRSRRTAPWSVELEALVGSWPDDAALLDWFAAGLCELRSVLAGAPADLQCWAFLPGVSPRAMWARRQAHETAVHRVDVELAAGSPSALAAKFAADGIDELLRGFVPRRHVPFRTDHPSTLAIRCDDVPGAWLLHVDSASVSCEVASGPADCEVSGPAAALYLALWNRAGSADLEVRGDLALLEHFASSVQIRWS